MRRATPAPAQPRPPDGAADVVLMPGTVIHPRYAGIPLPHVRQAIHERVDELDLEQLAALAWTLEALVSRGGSRGW